MPIPLARWRWPLAALLLLVAGALLKTLAVPGGRADLNPAAATGRMHWPWAPAAVVTPFFPEATTGLLVPAARAVAAATPAVALAELAAGPAPGRPLHPALPPGVSVKAVAAQGDHATVELDGPVTALAGPAGATGRRAIAATLGSLGISRVTVRLGDYSATQDTSDPDGVTLYYLHQGLPLPVRRTLPAGDDLPRRALTALFSEPAPPGVPWVPRGISVDAVAVGGGTAQVRLRLSPELLALVEAGAWNFAPYYMGVVYTLTELPGIQRVRFEFAGLSPLAQRQCRTPLAVALTRPAPEPALAKGVKL